MLGACVLLAGCGGKQGKATTTPAAKVATQPAQPKRVRLAVMRVEDEVFEDLAAAVTRELAVARVSGFDEVIVPATSLEVVQIQIECIDPTPACWRAAGRSVGATQMVLTSFATEAAGKSARAQRKKPVTVTLAVFDIAKGTEVRSYSKKYKHEKEGVKKIAELVNELASAPVDTAPVAQAGAKP